MEEKLLMKHLKIKFSSGNYYKKLEKDSSEGKNEESSESEDKITDISISEQIAMLNKFYGPDLISKYFIEKKPLKHFKSIIIS